MENPNHKWRFVAGKIIYEWAMASMAMLNNQRVTGNIAIVMGYYSHGILMLGYERDIT